MTNSAKQLSNRRTAADAKSMYTFLCAYVLNQMFIIITITLSFFNLSQKSLDYENVPFIIFTNNK